MLLWAARSAQCCTQVKRIFQVRRRESERVRVRCTSVRMRCDVDVDVGSSCCDNFFNCTFAPHTSFTLCVVNVVVVVVILAYFSLSSIVCTHTSIKSNKHTHTRECKTQTKTLNMRDLWCIFFSFSLALLFFSSFTLLYVTFHTRRTQLHWRSKSGLWRPNIC